MVGPLVVVIVIIIALGGAGAAIALNWDKIVTKIKGKDIVILGGEAVGKTTLHNFLRLGKVAEHYKKTSYEKVPANRYKLEDLELVLKDGVDIGGSDDFIREWRDLFKECDYCLYLFDTYRTHKDDQEYIERITKHLTFILKWSSSDKKQHNVYVIGTFADKVPHFLSMSDKEKQDFNERIRLIIRPTLVVAGVKASEVIIGSLKSNKQRELLVHGLLLRIAQE